MALTEYPNSVSSDVWEIVYESLQGQWPDRNHAIHAVWDALGFGLGQLLPDQTLVFPADGLHASQEALATVKTLADGGLHAGAIPWTLLLPVLFQLLQSLLSR